MIQLEQFVKNNAGVWSSLEVCIKNFSGRQRNKHYTRKEIDGFIMLYNQVTNHLAFSRTNYGDNEITDYLNKLAASAHSIIYTSPKPGFKSFIEFFTTGFPQVFRRNIKYFIVSSLIFILAGIFMYFLTYDDPQNSYAFLDPSFSQNIRSEGGNETQMDAFFSSSYIMTNNIKVCFAAFVLGITLGIGTVISLFYNGILIGCLAAVTALRGQAAFFWSLIVPHGVPELFAVFLCGAAGLMIGYSIIHPGKMSRKDALIVRGREAMKLVIGCVPILVIAGIIEGYFTPVLSIPYAYKYIFAAAMLVLLVLYMTLPGRNNKTISIK